MEGIWRRGRGEGGEGEKKSRGEEAVGGIAIGDSGRLIETRKWGRRDGPGRLLAPGSWYGYSGTLGPT